MSSLKSIFIIFLCLSIFACNGDGDDEKENKDFDLVGEWERPFDRNGSSGNQIIEISPSFDINFIEIGDDLVMSEWYSGLESGITFEYRSDPGQPMFDITENSFSVSEIQGLATIRNTATDELVASWSISSIAQTYNYEMQNNGRTLIIIFDDIRFEYQKI